MTRPITRIIRFMSEGRIFFGEEPEAGSSTATILSGSIYDNTLSRTEETKKVEKLLSPVDPAQIICIGINYLEHFNESAKVKGLELPTKPTIFMKTANTLNHPEGQILIPSLENGSSIDYEVELAVVIGKPAKNVKQEDALKYVAGYTVSNDVTNRYWQMNAGAHQWIKGKSFDTFAPLGPVLVTPEEIPDPQALRLSCKVNSETRQDSSTGDMIFSVKQIIEWLSQDQTLTPGTVIMTGTPQGVAFGMKEPKWLKDGDVVETSIEKIGTLKNYVVGATQA